MTKHSTADPALLAPPPQDGRPSVPGSGVSRRKFVLGGLFAGAMTLAPAAVAKADTSQTTGGTSSVQVTNEILWSTDPRVGLNAGTTADQTTQLQAMANLLCQSPAQYDRVGYLVPGSYHKSAPITFNNTDGHPFKLFGQGAKVAQDAPTVIVDTKDCGSGTHSLEITGSAPFHIEGISLLGSMSPSPKGSVGWQMRGLALPGYCTVIDFAAEGYFAGIQIQGSYIMIADFDVRGNAYGIDFGPGLATQEQIVLKRGRAGGASMAAFGVASSGVMSGVRCEDVEGSTSPYVIKRYDDGTGKTVATWISGVEFTNVATEYTGNAIVCNTIDDAGISNVVFDHGNVGNWALYSAYVDSNGPQKAAWYSLGPISDVTFVKSLPTSTASQPAVLASAIIRVTTPEADGLAGALNAGVFPFELLDNQDGSKLSGSHLGDGRGYRALVVPFMTSNAVRQGTCLTATDAYNVAEYSGSGRVVGIAGHAASSGQVVHSLVNGIELSVLNTSSQTIPINSPLVPDPNGGVAAGGYSTGQVIGRAFNAIPAGQLGPAELHV